MPKGKISELTDRGLVRIHGPGRFDFLQNLFTCNVQDSSDSKTQFGALLTPQGKLQFEFFVHPSVDSLLIDIRISMVPDFLKRLQLYKLRAEVEIEDASSDFSVLGVWDTKDGSEISAQLWHDPRLKKLGSRMICAKDEAIDHLKTMDLTESTLQDYHDHRIRLGVPSGGDDYEFGSVFPHDVNMDILNGIDFAKGCFVGQEVVSRMRHRGTARKRTVQARANGHWPEPGTEIFSKGKAVGTLGSSSDGFAIALVRLDRVRSAMDSNEPFLAGNMEISFELPNWADFNW